MTIVGFLGAWLLVAGPLYQAALELRDENLEQDHFDKAREQVNNVPHVSVWWWLIPPVKVYLERRRDARFRREFMNHLSDTDLEAMVSFMSKATGWAVVSLGGFLLAVNETYELTKVFDAPIHLFWILLVVGLFASIFYVISRVRRSQGMLSQIEKRKDQ